MQSAQNRRVEISIPMRYLIMAGERKQPDVESLIEELITQMTSLQTEIETYKNEVKRYEDQIRKYEEKYGKI